MATDYRPSPLPTDHVPLPGDILALVERLAENAHEVWAVERMTDGWRYGPSRDDEKREHPCLVPYSDLPEREREYDRALVLTTVRTILALGYTITRDAPGDPS
ncbi:RyR domain-containing protein [Actinoplanes sp. CA-030573]|uniref:RyR domain-containing protein n=1 Tax=Actinoplanes sp. CA-030573 TaxID=3239898 RepID=UPI003D8E7F35